MSARFGPHVSRYHAPARAHERPSIAQHIEAARTEAAHEAGFRLGAAAIFVGGPQRREITLLPAERGELREYIARTGLVVIAHSAYSASPWTGDPSAAQYIRKELGVCQEAGVAGLVVHLPKLPVASVLKYIGRLVNPEAPDVRIYLETPAVKAKESYYETPPKIAALFRGIRATVDPDLALFGLCVDSAHLWVSNVDLRDYPAAAGWLGALEEESATIPPSAIMFHLNDSQRPRGVGPDAHAGLASGRIWEGYEDRLGESGLAAFVDFARRHGLVAILERKPREALKNDYLVLGGLDQLSRVGAQ